MTRARPCSITVREFDALVAGPATDAVDAAGLHAVPLPVFRWLEARALRSAEDAGSPWLRLTQRAGRRAVQMSSFVGVIRAPGDFQIEVLPKITGAIDGGVHATRELLIDMLRSLEGFRHIQTDNAHLAATRMPLLEVFIGEFLQAAQMVVRRGLRGDYTERQDNLVALRGKLQIAAHLRQNLCRRERFYAQFDEFSNNRPENRLLHSALRRALSWTTSPAHEQLARELCFMFADVPESQRPAVDFQQVQTDRATRHYDRALVWARLILQDESPLVGVGAHRAPSLLFPMGEVFEAFVARHLARQLARGLALRAQASSLALVRHRDQNWFRLKPDLLVQDADGCRLVLDTKWKLLDGAGANPSDKYGLSQADFYQLHAYGQNYLDGRGDVALIYPRTTTFVEALPLFGFPKSPGLRLWVLPFCLRERQLMLPGCDSLDRWFTRGGSAQPSAAQLCGWEAARVGNACQDAVI